MVEYFFSDIFIVKFCFQCIINIRIRTSYFSDILFADVLSSDIFVYSSGPITLKIFHNMCHGSSKEQLVQLNFPLKNIIKTIFVFTTKKKKNTTCNAITNALPRTRGYNVLKR